ncbi:hypothetical protein V6N13_043956 [Hibiscus sabdariffa]
MVQAQHGADDISGCSMGADGMLGLLVDGGGGLGSLGCTGYGPKGAVRDKMISWFITLRKGRLGVFDDPISSMAMWLARDEAS